MSELDAQIERAEVAHQVRQAMLARLGSKACGESAAALPEKTMSKDERDAMVRLLTDLMAKETADHHAFNQASARRWILLLNLRRQIILEKQ